MKKNSFVSFVLCVVFVSSVSAAIKSVKVQPVTVLPPQPLTFEGWIDMEQDDVNGNVPHFSTDFKIDASEINPSVLKKNLSEKVSLKGVFSVDTDGNPVFKVMTLTPMPRAIESDHSDSGNLDSLESDFNEEGH